MRRRTLGWIATVVLLVVVGGALLARRDGSATAVDVGAVAKKAVFRSMVAASGQIVASRYADVGASAMGRLVELRVKEGDVVAQGQVLARIDRVQAAAGEAAATARVRAAESDVGAAAEQTQSAEADAVAAEARAKQARQTLQRMQDLRAEGLVPLDQLDAARAASDSAAAQVLAARAAVRRVRQAGEGSARRLAETRADHSRANDVFAKTEILSPMAGVVTRLPVQEGEMVVIGIQNQPGTTLMTISDLSAIDAEVRVAEADVLRVHVGLTATVTLEAMPGTAFSGRVAEIGASALPVVGTGAAAREFKVKVRLDRPGRDLRPGLTCDTEILTAERQGVLTVPLQAVVIRQTAPGQEQAGVFVPEGGVARFRQVKTGLIGGLDIEVAGLAENTSVVVGPFQALRDLQDGQPLRVQVSK
ncbi:MAG: efflux RND transporter periplasmic adaptor subunit [Acidobacteriota bacterium]